MEFKEFKEIFNKNIDSLFKNHNILFLTDTDKDEIWETYLNSFPEGSNEIFRERREYDCSCCRQFIKSFGNVVVVDNNKLVTIWDFNTGDDKFQKVINCLSSYIKSKPIRDVFVTKESKFGVDKNYEKLDNGQVITWEHFSVKLPKKFINTSSKSPENIMGRFRDNKNVFKRSLEEISNEAIETVLDLIYQNSLYKGDEWKAVLNQFLLFHKEYHNLNENEKDIYCWIKSVETGSVSSKIRNHSIGTLLTNISQGMDLNIAVKKYETIVAPINYKRPKAIFTKKMIEDAQKKIEELGLLDSLERKYATVDDITINNILFANKDTLKQMSGDIFSELKKEATGKSKKFNKVEEVNIEHFINEMLPRISSIEAYVENKHLSNFVSLIAPKNKDSKPLFKWGNNFSWAYKGNITDSMKERVKQAGGNVDGILRFSLQWNEDGNNRNDFDAHCIEPNKNHIYYPNKGVKHPSSGMLDVDIQRPKKDVVAVENITWTDLSKMKEGRYKFYIHNFAHRGGRTGFKAELEYNGEIYSFEYDKELKNNEEVMVADIQFSKTDGIKFNSSLSTTPSTKNIWNIQTNNFQPVSVCMFSPNYWDEQDGIGHKHYFFMIKDCLNDEQPNGFFNEFLRQDLQEYKRVFEALGSKMKVEYSENQLSGLGFSSSKRNSLICKVDGNISRMIKLVF
ncbi:MAG: hypothetical protein ACOC2W_02410 [bacterium]